MVWPAEQAFQCHHGVPASRGRLRAGPDANPGFQCHHGVPASCAPRSGSPEALMGFNATTAFLLPARRPPAPRSDPRVSMPPRRSCFLEVHADDHQLVEVSMPPRRSCFDVRREIAGMASRVSMPPRRSCFPIIPQGGGLLSSPGRDIEGDGDRWVRTSVGFDGSFAPSPSIPPSEVRGSLFRTLDHLPVPQPRRVVFLKTNGSKSESSVAPRCVIGFLFRGPPIAGFPMGVRG